MKDKDFIKEINGYIETALIVKDFISSPDALAVVMIREILSFTKKYQEEKIGIFFDKKLSLKLDKIETLIEHFKKARSPK